MTSAASDAARPLLRHWVVGAVYAGAILVMLAPLAAALMTRDLFLIYLCGPAYVAHQIEEHWGDRFRRFVNDRIFSGRDVLTPVAVWWINLPGVWGVNIAALYAAWLWGGGAGLAAPYLMLVNGAAHGAGALRFGYNPGLVTSILVFLPLGALSLAVISATTAQHLVGLGIAVAIHALIVVALVARARRGNA